MAPPRTAFLLDTVYPVKPSAAFDVAGITAKILCIKLIRPFARNPEPLAAHRAFLILALIHRERPAVIP